MPRPVASEYVKPLTDCFFNEALCFAQCCIQPTKGTTEKANKIKKNKEKERTTVSNSFYLQNRNHTLLLEKMTNYSCMSYSYETGPNAIKIAEVHCKLLYILWRQVPKLKIILLCNFFFIRNLCMEDFLFHSHSQNDFFITIKF